MRFIRYGVVWVVLATGVLIAGSRPASATTGLIVNGSFEKPVVAAGGFREFGAGQGFAGWRVVGARGRVAVVSGRYLGGGITFNARTGAQWMDLTGDESNTATGVAQSFTSIPGRKYHLTFWVGNVYDPGGIFGVSSAVKVYVNGVRKLTAVNSLHPAGHRQAWKKFTLAITATSGRTTISFINGDPRTDNSNGLDGVQVS
jgi:transposase